jgi:hypothetical protein
MGGLLKEVAKAVNAAYHDWMCSAEKPLRSSAEEVASAALAVVEKWLRTVEYVERGTRVKEDAKDPLGLHAYKCGSSSAEWHGARENLARQLADAIAEERKDCPAKEEKK